MKEERKREEIFGILPFLYAYILNNIVPKDISRQCLKYEDSYLLFCLKTSFQTCHYFFILSSFPIVPAILSLHVWPM